MPIVALRAISAMARGPTCRARQVRPPEVAAAAPGDRPDDL